ncbi:extracellular catalytic domain type 1 short-chain-length polyhydroxyalkanoate depolymerase [Desulfolithobacter sp.]
MFHRVKTIILISAYLILTTTGCAATADSIKNNNMSERKLERLNVHGQDRSFIVYRPVSALASQSPPLMIVLHGGLGNAEAMERTTGMNKVADREGFIVVYPNGTAPRYAMRRKVKNMRTWNAGSCCGPAVRFNVDDVAFISNLIERMQSEYGIDPRRVYVAGFSNGAMLAYRLACEIPEKIAAIIAVSGTLAVDRCSDSANQVAVLHIHGEMDDNVPYKGGRGHNSRAGVRHRSVEETVRMMTATRNCASPKVEIRHGVIKDTTYTCANGAPFELITIKNGGHVWPGGHGRRNTPEDGRYISASEKAWTFAQKFKK